MNNKTQSGMTLIEIILVILLISIFGSIASSKIGSSSSLTLGQQADLFLNEIRHAQSLAQLWGCDLTVVANSSTYEIRNRIVVNGKTQCSIANSVIKDPSTGQNLLINLKQGVLLSPTGSFYFDHKGIPRDSATTAILAAATTYTLSGDGNTYTVTISDITGFVSVVGP